MFIFTFLYSCFLGFFPLSPIKIRMIFKWIYLTFKIAVLHQVRVNLAVMAMKEYCREIELHHYM